MLGHSCGVPVILPIVTGFYMALFFIIAGMTTKEEDFLYPKTLYNKKKKLIIDYFSFSGLLLIFSIIELIVTDKLSISKVINMLTGIVYSRYSFHVKDGLPVEKLMCIENSPLWFLTALFLSFLVAGYVYRHQNLVGGTPSKRLILIGVLILLAVGLNYSPIILPWSIDCVPVFVIFIIVGRYLAEKGYTQLALTIKNGLIFLGLGVFYVALRVVNGHINISIRGYGELGIFSVPIYTILGVLGTFLCIVFCYWIENSKFSRYMSIVGRHSLFIMSFHMLVFHWLNFIMPEAILTNKALYYLFGLLENAIALSICLLVSIAIKRYSPTKSIFKGGKQ